MTTWKAYKLGELCNITSSKRIFYHEYVSTGVPFYRSKEIIEKAKGCEISTELFISKNQFNEIKSKFGVPKTGDILLTSVGTLGVTYQVKENDYFYFKDGNLTWLKDFSTEINTNFLLYWLRSPLAAKAFNEITIGSTQAALTIAGLKQIILSIPDYPTQTAIAEILSSLDDKIELNNKINQELENLAQTLFKQWFIDFEFPNENGEPYKSSGGEMVESELGEIPKGWSVGTLKDILDVKGGTTPSTKEPALWDGDFHWTSPKDLSSLKFPLLTDTEKKITELGLSKIGSGLLPKGTLLLSSRAPIGYLAITEIETAINQGYIAINGKKGFSNLYILYWLKLNMDLVIARANGSTFLEISKSNFKEITSIIPDCNILKEFTSQIDLLFNLLKCNIIQNKDLAKLRETLLPKLILGELEVENVKI